VRASSLLSIGKLYRLVKIERWHKTRKGDCIRTKVPLSLDEARVTVGEYVTHYNEVRFHSAIAWRACPADTHHSRCRTIAECDSPRFDHRKHRPSAFIALPFKYGTIADASEQLLFERVIATDGDPAIARSDFSWNDFVPAIHCWCFAKHRPTGRSARRSF